MIEACPQGDLFTDWDAILDYIKQIEITPATQPHVKDICTLLSSSVKIQIGLMNDGNAMSDAAEEKIMQLLELLPDRLQEVRHEVVGEILFVYREIGNDLLLVTLPST